MSVQIDQLRELAKAEGFDAPRTKWGAWNVYWFANAMPDSVRSHGAKSGLEYQSRAAQPHSPAHELFLDREAMLSIVFETNQ